MILDKSYILGIKQINLLEEYITILLYEFKSIEPHWIYLNVNCNNGSAFPTQPSLIALVLNTFQKKSKNS